VNRRKAYNLAFCSSVLSHERKDQVGDEMEQSACRRAVLRGSTLSSNDPGRRDVEGNR
ncbi:hypothetical protein H5410_036821, partial [Solanum commersonii]